VSLEYSRQRFHDRDRGGREDWTCFKVPRGSLLCGGSKKKQLRNLMQRLRPKARCIAVLCVVKFSMNFCVWCVHTCTCAHVVFHAHSAMWVYV